MNVKSCVVLGVHVRIIVIAKNVYCHKPGRIEIPGAWGIVGPCHMMYEAPIAFK